MNLTDAVPLSASGRVEWDAGSSCDLVINLTGRAVRMEVDGGYTFELPAHGTARDLPPAVEDGYHRLPRPPAERGLWPHGAEPRVFFLLGSADLAPGRTDVLRMGVDGEIRHDGPGPSMWVPDCLIGMGRARVGHRPGTSLDTGGVPVKGAIYIEPPATRRAAIEAARAAGIQVHILDPQHGGSLGVPPNAGWNADRWPDGWCDRPNFGGRLLSVAACTAALEVAAQCEGTPPELVVLQPTAGLDDFAAAAVLLHLGLERDPGAIGRLDALAKADNAAEHVQPWRPGQRLRTVADRYPGLSRLICCTAIPVERRVELVAEWLATGCLTPTYRELEAVCGLWRPYGAEALEEIDRVARADLDAGALVSTCEMGPDGLVCLVRSNLVGPSAGRGAFAEGYARAPVAACWSQPDPAQPARVTIGRAPNAAHLVSLDFEGLRAALDAAEIAVGGTAGWGGNPTTCVMGSPKPHGTRLAADVVVAEVRRAVADMHGSPPTPSRTAPIGALLLAVALTLGAPAVAGEPPTKPDVCDTCDQKRGECPSCCGTSKGCGPEDQTQQPHKLVKEEWVECSGPEHLVVMCQGPGNARCSQGCPTKCSDGHVVPCSCCLYRVEATPAREWGERKPPAPVTGWPRSMSRPRGQPAITCLSGREDGERLLPCCWDAEASYKGPCGWIKPG